MRARAPRGRSAASTPSTVMFPASQSRMPVTHLMIVLFPAPLGPSRPVTPSVRANVTPFTASRRPYDFTSPSTARRTGRVSSPAGRETGATAGLGGGRSTSRVSVTRSPAGGVDRWALRAGGDAVEVDGDLLDGVGQPVDVLGHLVDAGHDLLRRRGGDHR